ncbi:hypothetical protein D3C76_1688820 [compost metagenome]
MGSYAAFSCLFCSDADYDPLVPPVFVHMEPEIDRAAVDFDEPDPLLGHVSS